MEADKAVMREGVFGAFRSVSTFANPLNINFTGGVPSFDFGYSAYFAPGFLDYLEPLPTESVSDDSATLTFAGFRLLKNNNGINK